MKPGPAPAPSVSAPSVRYDAFDDYQFQERWAYDRPGIAAAEAYEDATRDIFSALFRRKWEYTTAPDSAMKDFLDTLKSTEDYKHLRATTTARVGPAYEAARNLVRDFASNRAKDDRTDAEKRNDARRAMRSAQKQADEYEDIENTLGLGSMPSTGGGEEAPVTSEDQIRLIKTFRDNPNLLRLIRLAGRMINLAENTLHNETTRGVDKLVGVEVSDDLTRVLPSELWMTGEEDLFLFKLVNKDLLCHKYEGEKTKGYGPIVLLVDKSSSMSSVSERWDYARALTFSIAHLALAQRRTLHICMFNESAETPFIPTSKAMLAAWLLKQRTSGGTIFDRALYRAMAIVGDLPTADIIMVTDGEGDVSAPVSGRITEAKEKRSLRMFSLVCGTKVPACLETLSNESHTVARLLDGAGMSADAENKTKSILQGAIR